MLNNIAKKPVKLRFLSKKGLDAAK